MATKIRKNWTGQKIRDARKCAGMTQPQLAAAIGCPRWQTIGEWERGVVPSSAYQQLLTHYFCRGKR